MTGEDTVITVTRQPISLVQLIGWGAIILSQGVSLGIYYSWTKSGIDNAATKSDLAEIAVKVDDTERYRVTRALSTDKNFDDIRSQMAGMPDLRFTQQQTVKEVAEQKAQLVEANKRMDRIVEMLGGKLDSISNDVNTVKSDVRLLSSKVDGLAPEKRAELNAPPAELVKRVE